MFLDLVFLFILDIYAEVGLLDHIVVLFLVLIFLETSILFCTIASPIYIPISSVQGFPFPPHPCQHFFVVLLGFPGDSAGKESVCHVGDLGLIPGLGRSPGEGNGYPLQYSGL